MWTPAQRQRRLHQRRLVADLARAGRLSRAELAEHMDLSAPAVGNVVEELLAAGVVELTSAAGLESRVLGRPAQPLQLARGAARFVAVQLGVRHTRLAALPVAGPTEGAGVDAWPVRFTTPKRAATWAERLCDAAHELGAGSPWAVVLSLPGVVDEVRGVSLLSPNLHWLESADLPALVRRAWPADVVVVQEIRALALGHLSAADAARDFLLVDFGEGIGAALVREGRLYDGALALSGELGHTPVTGNPRKCGCGGVGCLETLLSRGGLLASFTGSAGEKHATWRQMTEALNRKREVEAWLTATLDATASVIAGCLNVVGVDRVVMTGWINELPGFVFEYLADAIGRGAMWGRFGKVSVEAAARRRAAGMAAAAVDRWLLPEGEPGPLGTQGRESLGVGGGT